MKTESKRKFIRWPVFVVFMLVLQMSGLSSADETKKPVGINLDVEISSIYNFRGWNTFQEKSQQDQNGLLAPSITWSIFDTGLSIGYWGAYQISGSNQAEMVDVGLGHEQDLFLGYSHGWKDDFVVLSAAFTYFFYPFADEDVAGTANPSFIEPLIGLTISPWIDISLNLSYFAGLQDAVEDYRYLYINPSLGKSFEFSDRWGMALGLSVGVKIFNDYDEMKDNVVDVGFDWSFPVTLAGTFYVEPAVHLAWTNMYSNIMVSSGLDDNPATPDDESMEEREPTFGDEFMVYFGMNLGADF